MDSDAFFGRNEQFDVFTDLLFNALLGFVFMFLVAFMLINPISDTGKVDPKAEVLITMTWPDNHPDDIDLYVEDPSGGVVWYHVKESGLMHLDRDDRGNYRDVITVDGNKIQNPLNQETVTIRGIVPGEFIINIHHYLANGTDEQQETNSRQHAESGGFNRHVGRRFGHLAEIDGPEREENEKHAKDKTEVTNPVDDKCLLPGVRRTLLVIPKANEEIRTQPDPFPADEHHKEGAAEHQDEHEKAEQVQITEKANVTPTRLVGHVGG